MHDKLQFWALYSRKLVHSQDIWLNNFATVFTWDVSSPSVDVSHIVRHSVTVPYQVGYHCNSRSESLMELVIASRPKLLCIQDTGALCPEVGRMLLTKQLEQGPVIGQAKGPASPCRNMSACFSPLCMHLQHYWFHGDSTFPLNDLGKEMPEIEHSVGLL